MSVGWDMECHFSECRIKKKKKGGRETACHLFALIQDRTRGREQRVCVCVYRHTVSTRDLLPPPFVRSAALLICTAAGPTSSEWKLSKLVSPSHNPAALCFSHHPPCYSQGSQVTLQPTRRASVALLQLRRAGPSRSAPPKWPRARFEPFFLFEKAAP